MSSPFEGLQNATLTFKAAGTTGAANPVTGNKTFTRSSVVVEAMLEEEPNRAAKIERSPGVDLQAIYLEGFAVIPTELPASVKPNTWAENAVWNGIPGKFYLLLTGKSPFYNEAEATGQPIRGWFQAEV